STLSALLDNSIHEGICVGDKVETQFMKLSLVFDSGTKQ
uniref:Transposase n=1 Tax=Strongyloides papillosus TaxID=174720 RepID=A0A0N5BZ47_STREA